MQGNSSTSNFNNKFFVVGLLVFIFMSVIFSFYLGELFEEASKKNVINAYNQKRFDEFYSLDKNSIDLVFLGSSHSYCSFDPEIFDEELGIKSFQMGMPSQHTDATYYTFLEILNYQKPKTVVMELYWDMLDDEFSLKQADMLFQVIKNEQLINQFKSKVFPIAEKIKYNIKAVRFQEDFFGLKNKEIYENAKLEYNLEKENIIQTGQEFYRSKGYVFCDYNMIESEYYLTNQFKELNGTGWKINSVQESYLIKIVELARENNVELKFVTAPIANVSLEYIKNYDDIHNAISEFALKNKIDYVDYNIINREQKLFSNINFRDDAHLNHSGVIILDKHYIKELIKTKSN